MYPRDGIHQSEKVNDGQLQVRLGRKLKEEFKSVCTGSSSDYGKVFGMSDVVRMFVMKMVAQRRQMPETRHATIMDQVDLATQDVVYYMPVVRSQKEHCGRVPNHL